MPGSEFIVKLTVEDYRQMVQAIKSSTGKSLETLAINSPREAYELIVRHLSSRHAASVDYNGKRKTSSKSQDETAKLAAYLLENELPNSSQEVRVEVHVFLTASELTEAFETGVIPIPNKAEQKNWKMPTKLAIGLTVYPKR